MKDVLIAFSLVAFGAALSTAHHRICDKATCQAYENGYGQAQKEERIRTTAEACCEARQRLNSLPSATRRIGEPFAQAAANDARQAEIAPSVSEAVMDSLQTSGHAAARLR